MGKIYRLNIKKCIALQPLNDDEQKIIRNGLFKDDSKKIVLTRLYNIGGSVDLRNVFGNTINPLCTDKAHKLIMEKLLSKSDDNNRPLADDLKCLNKKKEEKFVWSKLQYSVGCYLKSINSIEDTEIE